MDFAGFVLFGAFIVLVLVMQVRGDARCRVQIQRWAAAQGAQVLSIQRRWFFIGPFWLRTSRSQRVYDVQVLLPNGEHRFAVVRVGGWLLGSLDDRVDAHWR